MYLWRKRVAAGGFPATHSVVQSQHLIGVDGSHGHMRGLVSPGVVGELPHRCGWALIRCIMGVIRNGNEVSV